jgi:hypothetical protein
MNYLTTWKNWLRKLITALMIKSSPSYGMPLINDVTMAYALSFLGTDYIWGGQSQRGVDCSGFVIMVLQAQGRLPNKFDATSQGLYDYFKVNRAQNSAKPRKGCLAFYGKSKNQISHIAICLNSSQIIEAGGGNSSTTTPEKAKEKGAHVRIRPINYRSDLVAILTSDINERNVLSFPKSIEQHLED